VRQSPTPEPAGRPRGHRLHITCVACGHRHALERRLTEPETVHIVCHECEALLAAHDAGASSPEPSRPPGRDRGTAP
jgi:hypothetical protein